MVIMKDMNVYKAEIFRRSEERIAIRRKNRNRIIASCIPLFLLIGIWSVMILPAMLPAGSEDFSPEEEMYDGGAGSLGTPVHYDNVKIEILDFENDLFQEYSETVKVEALYDRINSCFAKEDSVHDENIPENESEAAGSSKEPVKDTAKPLRCRITFSSADGKEKSYLLYQNTLLDEAISKQVVLTAEELRALKSDLGWSE